MKKSTQWSDHFKSMPHLKILKMKPARKPAIKKRKGQKNDRFDDIASGLAFTLLVLALPFLPHIALLIAGSLK